MNIHPSFFILTVIIFFSGKISDLILALVFILFHEICHIIFALIFGIKIEKITLTPIGMTGSIFDENIKKYKKILFYISGPLFNLLMALIFYLSNLHKDLYSYFTINFIIGIFNLLPCYPLDGGNIFFILFEDVFGTLKTLKITILLSKILGFIFVILGIIQLILYPLNMGLFIIGMFILRYNKNIYSKKYLSFCKKILCTKKTYFDKIKYINTESSAPLKIIINKLSQTRYSIILFSSKGRLFLINQNKIMYLYLKFGGDISLLKSLNTLENHSFNSL